MVTAEKSVMDFTVTEGIEILFHKDMISDVLWKRLFGRLAKENSELSEQEIQMILDDTIGFLKLCGEYAEIGMVPSENVDLGWHVFLMYTRDYQNFCRKSFGCFVHHEPNDKEGESLEKTALDTVKFMDTIGFPYHEANWPRKNKPGIVAEKCEGGSCGSCDSGPGGDCGQGNCNSSCAGDE